MAGAVIPPGRVMMTDTPQCRVDALVQDQWSLAETVRHLILASDAWAS